MRFENKVAVVLGGNSGIGLAIATALAAEGARVVISGRDESTLKQAAADTGAELAVPCEIADNAALDAFYAKVKQHCGHIDVLFVNAGIGAFAPLRSITETMWDDMHAVNLRGGFFAAQKALALMQAGGAMVFTGSVASTLGKPGNCLYAATKAGLRALVRNLAAELVGEGIRVNMVSPGPTDTPIITRSGLPPEAVAGLRERMSKVVPMQRLGQPSEIAAAMLFLASDEASFITGVDLYVDGGAVELG